MAEIDKIAAELRPRSGKSSARAARRAGQIPGVLYGGEGPPLAIALNRRELDRELAKGRFSTRLLDLEVDGKVERVLPREVQFHVVTDQPLHADFMRLTAGASVTVMVPVHFVNEVDSPGIKLGGVLNVVRHRVEFRCRADQIPEFITVDLAGRAIGDSIHISAVKLPEGVTPTITDRDFTIATIAAPTLKLEIETPAAAAVTPEAAAAATPAPAAPGKG
ncbi:MAG: 50S ribosomal protein L25/general stress protein Ctc [Alphaproteobacteria bacterium]|nr:50S ribosomal protein L25/general stress protein Ctc [Alphaproteobacteria bacterium]